VGQPPVVVTQPQPQSVLVGQPATFSVTVIGDGPCTYQWRKSGVNIAGATASTLIIPAAQLSDQANYSVVITCQFGTVTSIDAPLTVNEPPRIVFDPISEFVIAGTNAIISADAVGTEPLTYQWYYESTFTGQNAGTPVANATGATLVFRDVALPLTGHYYCIARNPFGSATSKYASIDVLSPPVVQSHPTSISVASGGSAVFAGSVAGTGMLMLQWLYNGQPITGATNATLAMGNVQLTQAGTYQLRASNLLGTATTTVAFLTVDGSVGGSGSVRTLQLPVVQSGTLTLQFTTSSGQAATTAQLTGLRVQGSSDLATWADVPVIISVVGDRFQITLNDPAVLPYRFYRVIYP